MPTRWNRLITAIHDELKPYPGRTLGTFRDALAIVLAMIAAMVLQLPGISLALALILLLQRESAGVTFRTALEIAGGAALGLAGVLLWVQATDGVEVMRFLGVALLVFTAGFGMAASRFPLVCTMFGFYGFVFLSSWDTHRSASAIVTTSLYQLASLCLALGTAVVVNFFFANRHPAEALHEELHKRLQLLCEVFQALASATSHRQAFSALHHKLLQLAAAGDAPLNQLYEEAKSYGAELEPGLHFRIGLLARSMNTAAVLPFEEHDAPSAAALASICETLLGGSAKPLPLPPHASIAARSLYLRLSQYATGAQVTAPAPQARVEPATSFALFRPDAFRNTAASMYALKLTLSAMICYTLYNAIAWPGILTCVVTVLFTGLSTTGAMKQRQIFRLSGTCIGGAIALFSESVFFPNMDSITSLVLLAGAVALLSAWVSRSPSIGSVGVQITFAFFLTSLTGFSASATIAPARDRVIGVALGIAAMWLVFDQLWPLRPSQALRQIRDRIATSRDAVFAASTLASLGTLRQQVSADLATMQTLTLSAAFDFGHERGREFIRSRRLGREIEAAAAEFYLALHSLEVVGADHRH
ncbi:FUSC family protein [Edaphobacter modestus]|uniref:Multidrug resistance protein MdtO n=1 Tax=Edaphobacter modestus TaxID=388466 RepID=A0A4Q7YVT8_9BACT|nr:FUSC family protein [Edaphobacter modestus]RZU41281.1 multidrug resistance protein MdtO [Edaphobacter modestus]